MGRKKLLLNPPKAFACALLTDNGRSLFLVQKERYGKKRLVLPFAKIEGRKNPVAEIKNALFLQSGIDGQVHQTIFEGKYNVGSNKYKKWVPLLVFKITAKKMQCSPSKEFEGFRWLAIGETLKKEKKKELFLEKWLLLLLKKMKQAQAQKKQVEDN